MNDQAFHISKLKKIFSDKQRKNINYSLRAFSRDVGIDSSSLGKILRGERPFPKAKVDLVFENLELGPADQRLFLESLHKDDINRLDQVQVNEVDKRHVVDESYFHVIAEWEHYAVLELFDLKEFSASQDSIARKLNISPERAEVVLTNLMNSGLVRYENNQFKKVYQDIKTTEDIKSLALKKSHEETLEIGLNKLKEIDLEFRDFSSMTVAIDLKKISEAKELIREFRRKMAKLLDHGDKNEVYNLAIQLYPLSHINNEGEKQ